MKKWIGIGLGALVLAAIAMGIRKRREDRHYEKVERIIHDVDLNQEDQEPKTVDEMSNDIEQAFRDMELDDEADAYADAVNAIKDEIEEELDAKTEDILKNTFVGKMNAQAWIDKVMSGKKSEADTDDILKEQEIFEESQKANGRSFDEIEEEYQNMQAAKQAILDGIQKRKEDRWLNEVKTAIAKKNFGEMEDLFDQKYAEGPWHPSPASVFASALTDGVITEELCNEAAKHFGKLWTYSGD